MTLKIVYSKISQLFLLILLLAPVAATSQTATANNQTVTIIDNVNILPMTGDGIQRDKALVIRNGLIEEIVSRSEVQDYPGARLVDGQGGFLIPGLVDAHIHHRTDEEFLNYIYYGVTTVLGLGQSSNSLPRIVAMREAINNGETLGPKIYTTGQTIANHIKIEDPAMGAAYVRDLKEHGFDFVKVYNNIPQPVFDTVVETAREQGLAVFGHLPRNFPAEYSLTHGLDVIAHAEEFYFAHFGGPRDQEFDDFDAADIPDMTSADHILDLMIENDVALIPNLIFTFEQMKFWDDRQSFMAEREIRFLHPELRSSWENNNSVAPRRSNVQKRILRERIKYSFIHEFTRMAHDKGVLIVAGTDAPLPGLYPGKSLHSEMRELVKAGFSYYEALSAATANASKFVNMFVDKEARIGLIKPGFEADLVLIRENPLDDIRNTDEIEGVMVDGIWFSRETLDSLRSEMVKEFPAQLPD